MNRYFNKTALLCFVYALAVLPIFIFRDFTPDNELKYLSIADEALESGSIFTFTNHGTIYADKPPLYLWIVKFGKVVFGHHSMLFLAMFSLLPALVMIYIMDKWVAGILTLEERFGAQLMLFTSIFFIGSAIVLRMDMLMSMFIVLALYTFFRMYEGKGSKYDSILFPVYIFMALFTKGPVGIIVPLVSVITFLVLKKEYKLIGTYWGWKTLIILVILCSVWFIGAYIEGGNEYLNNLLIKQTVNRAVNAFHHKEPFYYYFIAFWYTLAPWSLLIGAVLWNGFKKRTTFSNLELFFLVTAFSTVITLSLFSSKLAIYMLPALPFFVYLTLMGIHRHGNSKWYFILLIIPSALLCAALPATLVYKYFVGTSEFAISAPMIMGAALLSLTGTVTIKCLINKDLIYGIKSMSIGIIVSVFTVSFAIPDINHLIGLKQLCLQAKAIADKKGGVNYYYCGLDKANNCDVYLEAELTELDKQDLLDNNKIKTPAIVFLRSKEIEENDTVKAFAKDRKYINSGDYYCVELENKKQNK